MSEKNEQQQLFEFKERPVIKGFPELRWTGKKPYTSTQYYPAQIKEKYGSEQDGWINKIFWGDNLQVMSHLLKEYRGRIDLIYIDPPFDSKADYKKKIEIKGIGKTESDSTSFEEKQYGDIWSNDEYLQFMYERLILCRELLNENGSIYVHMDEKRVHYIRLLMDEIFGQSNFRREIIWDITVLSGFKSQAQNWIRGHDVILYYSKTKDVKFNKLSQKQSKKYLNRFNKVDEDGRRYFDGRGERRYLDDVIKKGKPYGDVWGDTLSYQTIKNELLEIESVNELSELNTDLSNDRVLYDVWGDIMSFQQIPTSVENSGYPTQKPESLLQRIILSATNPGDLVFDCFMGSGTTQAVSMKTGRRFIGADINLGAIQTTTKRLLSIAEELNNKIELDNPYYTGFEVYNVNNYDFFRNPVEAKDLLLQALEIQPFDKGGIWDGELDGRMVKIMPVNRIATKADLEELKARLPYATYEKRRIDNPSQPAEKITIVCMGHDADLKASLEKDLDKYKIDIQIVDILKDKSELQFKREAEAEIAKEGNKLVIRSFYPMNLMQKLSLQKEKVDEWRQLVESIMIDWNYDGAVINPSIIDIPEKNDLVKGVYSIPEDAGTIKVKITDLLSESLEIEV